MKEGISKKIYPPPNPKINLITIYSSLGAQVEISVALLRPNFHKVSFLKKRKSRIQKEFTAFSEY